MSEEASLPPKKVSKKASAQSATEVDNLSKEADVKLFLLRQPAVILNGLLLHRVLRAALQLNTDADTNTSMRVHMRVCMLRYLYTAHRTPHIAHLLLCV